MRHVSKKFGTHAVLDNFSMDIAPREKLVLIGRSGSGKSTILRVLMTLEDIDTGDVTIDQEHLWRSDTLGTRVVRGRQLRNVRSKVGMVFQQFNLFPHMSALRNIAESPMRVLGISREEAEERARALLAIVGLSGKLDAYPAQLSGGQQQRVAIARALAMQPKILLFDEVTSALDPELVGEVLAVIRDVGRNSDCTMVMVTHHMAFAREFADRVCFLENGRIAEEGAPLQMFKSPSYSGTKAFLDAVLEN